MSRTSGVLVTLAFLTALIFPAAAAGAIGDATGSVVVNGKKIALKFASAKAVTEEGERVTTVILTDKPASRTLLGDSNRLQKAIAAGDLQALILEVSADGTLKQASLRSKQLQNSSTMPMMTSDITFVPSKTSADAIAGKAQTTKQQTFFDDAATFNVTFSSAVGTGKFADSPAAVKQLAAKSPKIGEGGAVGTLTFDSNSVKLSHAFATTRPNPFEEKKVDVVVYLTNQPVDREMVLSRRKLLKAIDGGMRGMIVSIDSTETPTSLELLQPGRSMQLSGSGVFEFDPVQVDETRAEGRFYTSAPADFMDHKYSYDVSFRKPVETVIDPRSVAVDASNGQKLPANGGQPGAAWLALGKAIRSGNIAQIAKLTAKGVDSPLDVSPEEQKQMLEMLKMMQPAKAKIVEGWANADRATLYVTGNDPMEKGKKAKGTIQLVLEDGAWKVLSEKWR